MVISYSSLSYIFQRVAIHNIDKNFINYNDFKIYNKMMYYKLGWLCRLLGAANNLTEKYFYKYFCPIFVKNDSLSISFTQTHSSIYSEFIQSTIHIIFNFI